MDSHWKDALDMKFWNYGNYDGKLWTLSCNPKIQLPYSKKSWHLQRCYESICFSIVQLVPNLLLYVQKHMLSFYTFRVFVARPNSVWFQHFWHNLLKVLMSVLIKHHCIASDYNFFETFGLMLYYSQLFSHIRGFYVDVIACITNQTDISRKTEVAKWKHLETAKVLEIPASLSLLEGRNLLDPSVKVPGYLYTKLQITIKVIWSSIIWTSFFLKSKKLR